MLVQIGANCVMYDRKINKNNCKACTYGKITTGLNEFCNYEIKIECKKLTENHCTCCEHSMTFNKSVRCPMKNCSVESKWELANVLKDMLLIESIEDELIEF